MINRVIAYNIRAQLSKHTSNNTRELIYPVLVELQRYVSDANSNTVHR